MCISSRLPRVRTGDLELPREKRAIKVMEAQSQLPGHIFKVSGNCGLSDDGLRHQAAVAGSEGVSGIFE